MDSQGMKARNRNAAAKPDYVPTMRSNPKLLALVHLLARQTASEHVAQQDEERRP
jgi:hypothetical protein